VTIPFLHHFIVQHRYAVLSTVTPDNSPESALVGFAVTPGLQLLFDTVSTSRKYNNLINNPSVALVIGWENEQTVQYEGIARIPEAGELETLLPIYFNVFPDGDDRRKQWKDLVYFAVDPQWIRYSDFNEPQRIEELHF
jgi:uncharacterized pyridoxamine 5'-phosphate oxidase family protein